MTFKERLSNETDWKKRVHIIGLFHYSMVLKNKKWRVKDSARSLGISIGQVSEDLKLCRLIEKYPILENCMTRKDALISVAIEIYNK